MNSIKQKVTLSDVQSLLQNIEYRVYTPGQ